MMQFLTAPTANGDLIRFALLMFLPFVCGMYFCVKSPFARGGKIRCRSCGERIAVSASVCPYCRRRVGVTIRSTLGSRFAQFMIGWFLGGLLEILLICAFFRVMLIFS